MKIFGALVKEGKAQEVAGLEPHRNNSFSPHIISRDQKYPQEESFYHSIKVTLRKNLPITRE